VGNYGFSSASQATTFATTVWNIFGGGSSSTRPFGTSIVDGFDLGIDSLDVTALNSKILKMGNPSTTQILSPQCAIYLLEEKSNIIFLGHHSIFPQLEATYNFLGVPSLMLLLAVL